MSMLTEELRRYPPTSSMRTRLIKRLARIGVVALLGLGTTLVIPAQAAQASYNSPLTQITSTSGFGLVWHATSSAAISNLDAALPNVSVGTLMSDTNHPMDPCSSAENAALPIAPSATRKLCWDSGDASTTYWNPQGMTSSGDADDDGAWGADRVLLSGWQVAADGSRHNDARVAFINYNDPSNASYRWTYLVTPNSTGSNFSAAKAHSGGMVWYGDKLMVTAVGNTSVAIRVFSMKHILRMTDYSSTIGRTSNGWAAYGYKYVMPQIGYYTYASGTCSMATNTGTPCFSSISQDRSTSPDSIVASEYFSDGQGSRLFRYSYGSDYLLSASSGRVAVKEAFRSGVANAQGVLAWNGRWYVAHSSATYHGQLWGLAEGSTGSSATCTISGSSTHMCWGLHPEALTYWYSDHLVWSQAEAPDRRVVFAIPLSSMP